jgi:hypothetical protein
MVLTQERLKKLCVYDSETGIFTRRYDDKRAPRWKAGGVLGNKKKNGYIEIKIDNKTYQSHRLAWLYVHGYSPENYIDHKNKKPWDNRITNLREINHTCNMRNVKISKMNTSGVTGVYPQKSNGKWRANIRDGKNQIHLGTFDNKDDAIMSRYNTEIKYNYFPCQTDSSAYRYLREHNLINNNGTN